jgi:predicted phosphoribosyltransferase
VGGRCTSPDRCFADRADAGRRLAAAVADALPARLPGAGPVLAVGLLRGGVLVAAALVQALRERGVAARAAALAVAKVRAPGRPELAVGAVTETVTVRSDVACRIAGVGAAEWAELAAAARGELRARTSRFPGSGELAGAAVLLVDDGLATGSTAQAGLAELRARGAAWRGLAVPVADAAALERVRADADAVVTLVVREPLRAVSLDYVDFGEAGDAEVRAALVG